MQRDITHCIQLVTRLAFSDYIWYVFLC